jgi:hypothetical protein
VARLTERCAAEAARAPATPTPRESARLLARSAVGRLPERWERAIVRIARR